nr:MAG: replication associated protein [Arizlama virus]
MFTINNAESDDLPASFEAMGVVQCVWQAEVGAAGTRHLQGYCRVAKKCSLAAMKVIHATAHWEPRKGTHEQAEAYCTKEETRAAGPWRFGAAPAPGRRSDLDAVHESLKEGRSLTQISDDHFGPFMKYSRGIKEWKLLHTLKNRSWHTEVRVYWGPTGTGKSRRALHEAGPDAYWVLQPGTGQACFFDGYEGQEHVVIDEFYGWIPYAVLLKMLDRYPLMVHTKGGATNFYPKCVWITSNKSPQEWYSSCAFAPLQRRLSPPHGTVIEMTEPWAPPGEVPLGPPPVPAVFAAAGIAQSSAFSVASEGRRVHGVVVEPAPAPARKRRKPNPSPVESELPRAVPPPPPPCDWRLPPVDLEPDEFGLFALPPF